MTNQQQPVVGVQRPSSNGLGIAGFVVSLVGLFTCGILCWLGALLSFIALFKRPRGFAIAGFIIGLLGMLFDLLVFFVFGTAIFGLCTAVSSGHGFSDAFTQMEMQAGSNMVEQYHVRNGAFPDDATGAAMTAGLRDGWGHTLRYQRSADGTDYEIRSAGQDGTFGTLDDVVRTKGGIVGPGAAGP